MRIACSIHHRTSWAGTAPHTHKKRRVSTRLKKTTPYIKRHTHELTRWANTKKFDRRKNQSPAATFPSVGENNTQKTRRLRKHKKLFFTKNASTMAKKQTKTPPIAGDSEGEDTFLIGDAIKVIAASSAYRGEKGFVARYCKNGSREYRDHQSALYK